MRFEIVVAPHVPPSSPPDAEAAPSSTAVQAAHDRASSPARTGRARRTRTASEVLDVFIDGANVTAQIRDTHARLVIRHPLVAVYDRALPFSDIVAAARRAIDRLLDEDSLGERERRELASAALQLEQNVHVDQDLTLSEPLPVVIDVDRDAPVSFGAEFAMRERTDLRVVSSSGAPDPAFEGVERTDMHALLFRGRVRAEVRGRSVDLGDCHPILFIETLLGLARRAFDSWERGLPMSARSDATGVLVGIHLTAEGRLALTLGGAPGSGRRPTYTFPALGVADVLEATLSFGRALVRAILRRDRDQSRNLRLSALRRALRESTEALREASQVDARVNPSPEPYRAFAAAVDESRPTPPPPVVEGRLRYAPRWRAIVPGIDLRATYLCGDRIVVGAAGEMWALDRSTGHVLWRSDAARGTSVVTPGGIARVSADGAIRVHDFGTGQPRLLARVTPRVGPVAGAVVSLSGLPKTLVVTEGEHHLVAIDLATGELRWRWSWGAGRRGSRSGSRGAPRVKRSGRLLYVTCGDGALTALDVVTGAVVWRVRDRLRFRTPPTVVHDALFVVSGGAHGVARLYRIDPYSGHVEWSTSLAEATTPCTVEGAPLVAVDSVAVPTRHKRGLSLATFRLADGSPVQAEGAMDRIVAPNGTSWLAVDDVFVGNAATGELVAVDSSTGELRWRHVLGPRPLEADVPRRLEPVLRCGALFVPCSFVAAAGGPKSVQRSLDAGDAPSAGISIVRPSDGKVLGAITPTEAIPDLLRVDEKCDVYVAEESGHVAAFGALPRLTLV
jgi:outer membrane protein assembly factor BamB